MRRSIQIQYAVYKGRESISGLFLYPMRTRVDTCEWRLSKGESPAMLWVAGLSKEGGGL